ncbi:portal protein [Kaistia sp. MMO-174]|uniref:portal protein n=1 Tax=Kaistia sp. MMO-174 TaxID=3081256 RepID=UPI003018E054
MSDVIEAMRARRRTAQVERDAIQPLLDEAFDYAIPYRRSTRRTGKGEKRVDRVFDQTAVVSAFRFAGKLQQDLVPTGQEFYTLEPGPIGKRITAQDGSTDNLTQQLSDIGETTHALFDDGEWDQAFLEMALDLSAGTGAMLILEGDDRRPARFISVAIDEVLLEGGPYNDITGIFWSRKWSLRSVMETWPDARLGPELSQLLKSKPETEIEVNQDTVWDPKARRWILTVWTDKAKEPIHESKTVACPWLTPRYFRVPGETYGRGPVMLAMPTIKTLNTAQRLTLQAAAIAMMGIYTAVDDGVFNPDLAAVEPGIFWKVARNGGTLGPSVQRLQDPRLDLSNIVLNELRMGVQAAMMDQSLPADGAAVRSATEILERVKRLASDHLGAFGRLVREIIVPAVQRVMEIAANKMLIQNAPPIDQLLVKIRVTSPIAAAREAERVQKIIQWLEMIIALLQDNAGRVGHIENALLQVGRAMGVPEELLVTETQREKMDQDDATAAAAAAVVGAADGGMPA